MCKCINGSLRVNDLLRMLYATTVFLNCKKCLILFLRKNVGDWPKSWRVFIFFDINKVSISLEKWDILANFQTLCTCAWLSALLLCSTFSKNNCATTHKMQNRSLIWVPNSSVTDFFYSCSYALACLCQVKMLSDISPNIKKSLRRKNKSAK